MKHSEPQSVTAGFELLEHTADMGIMAHAETQAGVFIAMAQGLMALMFSASSVQAEVQVPVQVVAEDGVELLVAWLNEVLYHCETKRLVPADFRILALNEVALEAILFGEPFDPARHAVERQAKAVTYHQAQLQQTPEGWTARVYVDL